MVSWISRSAIVALACSVLGASAAVAPIQARSSKYQLSVYYGQNAANQQGSQLPLSQYCGDTSISMMPIAFVTAFNGPGGVPVTNFANACTGPNFVVNGQNTNLLNCQANIGAAMSSCKAQHGTKFLISLGGATYKEGGWPSAAAAQAAAKKIFAIFGPKNYDPSVTYRPFGDVCIDGFDLDFEMNTNNLDAFAVQLRSLIDTYARGQIILTAAPQCPYPDANVGKALNAAVFDAVFIQFYNNYCSASSYQLTKTVSQQSSFNLASWQAWANGKRTKLFIGFVADPSTYGYTNGDNAAAIIKSATQFANFGGAMVWDMSLAQYKNPGFLNKIKGGLGLPGGTVAAKAVTKAATVPAAKAVAVPSKPAVGVPLSVSRAAAPAELEIAQHASQPQQKANNTRGSSNGRFKLRRRHAHHHRRTAVYQAPPITV